MNLFRPSKNTPIDPQPKPEIQIYEKFISDWKIEDLVVGGVLTTKLLDNIVDTRISIERMNETEFFCSVKGISVMLVMDKTKLLNAINLGIYLYYPPLKLV